MPDRRSERRRLRWEFCALTGLRGGRRFIAAIALAFMAAGCSTVIKTSSAGDDAAYAATREALVAAAADVAASPWPKPSASTLADRLAGAGDQDAKVSREDAVAAYLDLVGSREDAEVVILADAERHLTAAAALKSAAETACDAATPRLSDVALLEDAIGDLRETRSIYVLTLTKIDVPDSSIDKVKRDFDDAIKELGAVADTLAESAMKRRAQNFAGGQNYAAGAHDAPTTPDAF